MPDALGAKGSTVGGGDGGARREDSLVAWHVAVEPHSRDRGGLAFESRVKFSFI
jgi:hypothetical protein